MLYSSQTNSLQWSRFVPEYNKKNPEKPLCPVSPVLSNIPFFAAIYLFQTVYLNHRCICNSVWIWIHFFIFSVSVLICIHWQITSFHEGCCSPCTPSPAPSSLKSFSQNHLMLRFSTSPLPALWSKCANKWHKIWQQSPIKNLQKNEVYKRGPKMSYRQDSLVGSILCTKSLWLSTAVPSWCEPPPGGRATTMCCSPS